MPKYGLPCDNCGSSDAKTLYEDLHSWCYACNHLVRANKKEQQLTTLQSSGTTKKKQEITNKIASLVDRGISPETTKKFSVFVPDDPFYKYSCPLYKDGLHVANKFRLSGDKKGFITDGDFNKLELFGQNLFQPGSAKTITICEGYEDAMAAYELQGSRYPCVSIHSAATARKDCAENYEYLNSFNEIVICFDADEAKINPATGEKHYPGQEAAKKVAELFGLGKVRILTLQRSKDANDYLKAGLRKEFTEEWWRAPLWTPVGLKLAKDMWEEVKTVPNYESVPYPWKGLNDLTYGIRLSELVTITANPKVGKTSILREIIYEILNKINEESNEDNRGIGLMFLEEPNRDTLLGLMSLTANKPLHLPDIREKVSEEELKKYFDSVYGNEKIVVWDHFGSNNIQAILDYVRFMHNLGCKYIILDHLSIVVSDQNGDERKQLDEIATKLKQLTVELNIAIIVVIHQNRKGEIRGTAGVEQLSNLVIKLYRNMIDEDPLVRNTMKVSVEMNRFCGRTGPACYLRYSPETGRMDELDEKEVKDFEEGDGKKPHGFSSKEDW